MAYAQLAGLPAYYGLYAAFLPGMVAALWGSSKQLATGPVAVVSLLTASALMPFAAVRTPEFVALAVMMALMVGIVQACSRGAPARRRRQLPLAPRDRGLHQRPQR